jgi:hypothetical protein
VQSSTARRAQQQAADDEADKPVLVLTPYVPPTATAAAPTPTPVAVPPTPEVDPGVPMGLLLEPSDQLADPEPLDSPGRILPLAAAALVALSALWWGWTLSGVLVARVGSLLARLTG